MNKLILTLTLLGLSAGASAEYRAYQYIVKSNDPYAVATRSNSQYIVSTLNPQMFQSYHGGSRVSVDLMRTWICPGYTGKHKPVCNHPYDSSKDAKL